MPDPGYEPGPFMSNKPTHYLLDYGPSVVDNYENIAYFVHVQVRSIICPK